MAYLYRHSSFINKTVPSQKVTQCRCWHSHILRNVPGGHARRLAFQYGSNKVRPAAYVATKFTSYDDSWRYSELHYKSKYLYIDSTYSSLSLYQDLLIKRSYHTSTQLWSEESKDLNQKKTAAVNESKTDKNETESTNSPKEGAVMEKKEKLLRRIWTKTIAFFRHYYNGFKLFFVELRICMPLFNKYLRFGRSSLKRREYMQLTKSMGDLFRIMPLIPMLIVPFAELLIPVYMKLGLMPTTFESKKDKEEMFRVKIKKKLEMARVLSETLAQMPKKAKVKGSYSTIEDFTQFMEKVKSEKVQPTTEEIVKFSRLFEDELTMKHLSVQQLQALCNVLGLSFYAKIPSEKILRFQLRMTLRELEVDDKLIQKEGIESLTVPELQAANRARGMRGIGVSEERLKAQLKQWLELHIQEQIPSSLLLLSRTMYLQKDLTPLEQLKETISTLPDETVESTKIASATKMGEQVDNKTLLEMAKEEAKAIKEEEEQEKKEQEAELKAQEEAEMLKAQAEAQAKAAQAEVEAMGLAEADKEPKPEVEPAEVEVLLEKEPIPDIAEPIAASPREELKDAEDEYLEEVVEEVTPKDIEDIEAAIEHITLHEKEELEEVKEEIAEYKESVEHIQALSLKGDLSEQLEEYAGAKTLRNYVDKLISKTDKIIDDLQKDREQIQKNIAFTEVKLKYDEGGSEQQLRDTLLERKENLVSINDVLLSLKRLQKVPDDMRLQRILEVLDEDRDGFIDIKNILEVTEALGRENLKLNTSQVSAMVNLLQKEAELEFEEKVKVKQDKEDEKNGNVSDGGDRDSGDRKSGGDNDGGDKESGGDRDSADKDSVKTEGQETVKAEEKSS